VNKTDKAKVAPARPPYAPQLLRARRGAWSAAALREDLGTQRHPAWRAFAQL